MHTASNLIFHYFCVFSPCLLISPLLPLFPSPQLTKDACRDPARTNGVSKFHTQLPLNKGAPQLSGSFWDNLNLFAAGMITQSVDMRELHRRKVKSQSNGSIDLSLPQQVRMPSIEVALSAIFPTMMQDDTEEAASQNHSTIESNEDLQALALLRAKAGLSSSTKEPWAENMVAIQFKGVHSESRREETSEGGHLTTHNLVCTSDVIIRVRRPTKFLALKGMVDRDVSYNPQRGEFILQVQRPVNEPIFDILKSRIKSIDRFVNFLEAMEKAKGSIISESITLKGVVFCYSAPLSAPSGEEAAPVPARERWRVKMDLSSEEIDIHMEKDNPHVRVIDLARKLASTEGGIGLLMAWLPMSLHAMKAIGQLDTQWVELSRKGQGQLDFSMKSMTWINLKYRTFATSHTGANTRRDICIDVRIRPRRGEGWWHAWRNSPDATNDEFDRTLKAVWDGRGNNWLGLSTGAAAQSNGGVIDMLLAIDGAIRGAIYSLQSTSPTVMKREVITLD